MAFRKAESLSAERTSRRSHPGRSSLRGSSRGSATASVQPKSSGASLHTPTQARMSARFGHDFSQVKVHTDSQASSLASSLNANAYTVGEDIVFAEGEYQPGTSSGDKLIAHELTHVAQQAIANGDGEGVSDKDQPAEREAQSAAAKAVSGGSINVQSAPDAAVSRDGDDDKKDGSGGGFWSSVWNGLDAEG